MTTENILLKDLDEGIFTTMKALADEAEEREQASLALGWRYLAEHKKTPYRQNNLTTKYKVYFSWLPHGKHHYKTWPHHIQKEALALIPQNERTWKNLSEAYYAAAKAIGIYLTEKAAKP